jgi:diaminopimelate epimerase
MHFVKYHGLGNDYLVIEAEQWPHPLDPLNSADLIRLICDRHYGPGSDGILLGPLETDQANFALRIFNPDGSEAEKSGNGLRIFARYLWDSGRVQPSPAGGASSAPFTILTAGGLVSAQVLENGRRVTVQMGQASFDSRVIPVQGEGREVLDERMKIDGEALRYCAVSLGNPHCVVLCEQVSEALARRLGPQIEVEARFPRRTNVQFMKVLDRRQIQIEIWERGAGYTLASGSSSCAAAATAHRLGLCDDQITVHVPGGQIQVAIGAGYQLTMSGAVQKVYEGEMEDRLLNGEE